MPRRSPAFSPRCGWRRLDKNEQRCLAQDLAEARDKERRQDDGYEEQNGGNAELPVGDWGWMARFGTEHCDCLRCCPERNARPGL